MLQKKKYILLIFQNIVHVFQIVKNRDPKPKKITLSLPIEKKVTRIDKTGDEITKNISYILQFINSARIMARPLSLSNLVNNLSERIHRIKCKYGHNDKKCETSGIKYKYCNYFLEYVNFKED